MKQDKSVLIHTVYKIVAMKLNPTATCRHFYTLLWLAYTSIGGKQTENHANFMLPPSMLPVPAAKKKTTNSITPSARKNLC